MENSEIQALIAQASPDNLSQEEVHKLLPGLDSAYDALSQSQKFNELTIASDAELREKSSQGSIESAFLLAYRHIHNNY